MNTVIETGDTSTARWETVHEVSDGKICARVTKSHTDKRKPPRYSVEVGRVNYNADDNSRLARHLHVRFDGETRLSTTVQTLLEGVENWILEEIQKWESEQATRAVAQLRHNGGKKEPMRKGKTERDKAKGKRV